MDLMSKQATRQQTKQNRQTKQSQQIKQNRLRAARRRRIITLSIVAALVIVIAASVYLIFLANRGQTATTQNTNAPSTAPGAPVDGIACDQQEQTIVHYHAHVSIYINGSPVAISQGVGIATNSSCFYWMHTHDTSGVVHIEAPNQQPYTLGNFFHIWSQQFPQLQYPLQLDNANGWKVYVDGKPYNGDFHTIVLKSHMLVTLAYNSPKAQPDTIFNWGDLTQ